MTLASETQIRVANELLVELTNQGNRAATTVNATVLGAAALDAAAEFAVETGRTIDLTDAEHVAAGVQGVMVYLHRYTGVESERARRFGESWGAWLRRIASGRANEKRLLPQTTSTASAETRVAGHRPDFSRDRWDAYTLAEPRGGGRDGDDLGED